MHWCSGGCAEAMQHSRHILLEPFVPHGRIMVILQPGSMTYLKILFLFNKHLLGCKYYVSQTHRLSVIIWASLWTRLWHPDVAPSLHVSGSKGLLDEQATNNKLAKQNAKFIFSNKEGSKMLLSAMIWWRKNYTFSPEDQLFRTLIRSRRHPDAFVTAILQNWWYRYIPSSHFVKWNISLWYVATQEHFLSCSGKKLPKQEHECTWSHSLHNTQFLLLLS